MSSPPLVETCLVVVVCLVCAGLVMFVSMLYHAVMLSSPSRRVGNQQSPIFSCSKHQNDAATLRNPPAPPLSVH